MALINRISAAFVLLIALSSFVVAQDSGNKDHTCKSDEFWWENALDETLSRCLPMTPNHHHHHHHHHTHVKCPEKHHDYSWYYDPDNDCCVPTIPNPSPPECPRGYDLDEKRNKCNPHAPQPSGHYNRRSELKPRNVITLCPTGLDACPIPGLTSSDYECVDTKADLESCGGCVSSGNGKDCSALEGVWNVGCEQGACIIYTCAAGFKRAYDGKSCIAL